MSNTNKSLMIGIDAACWEYIDPLIKRGKLPNLQQLISEGVSGHLRSTIPPITSVAWSSLMRGVNPGKHGIYDWGNRKANSTEFTPITANGGSGVPFWEYLNSSKIKVGLFNVPMVYPAKEIDGFMVTGLPDTPQFNEKAVFPNNLYHELRDKLCQFYVDDMLDLLKEKGVEGYFQQYKKVNEVNTQIAINLIEKYDVQVFVMNYMITDHLNHFAEDFSYVERAYEDVDMHLGTLKKHFPEANFIIFSDHGSRRTHKKFLINKWLYKMGYLKLERNTYDELKISDFENVISCILQNKFGIENLIEKVIRKIIKFAIIIVKPIIWKYIWRRFEKKYPDITDVFLNKNNCDLGKTIAFSSAEGNLFFNKEHNSDRDIDALKTDLLNIKIRGEDKKLFSNVYKKDELYHGSRIADAPEIFTYLGSSVYYFDNRIYNFAKDKNPDEFFASQKFLGNAGDHTKSGILIMSGDCFINKSSGNSINVSILDLTPTLFTLHDVPIPMDFDGNVLWEMFSDDIKNKKKPKYQKPMPEKKTFMEENPEDTEKIISRLKDLGYL